MRNCYTFSLKIEIEILKVSWSIHSSNVRLNMGIMASSVGWALNLDTLNCRQKTYYKCTLVLQKLEANYHENRKAS